MMNQQEARVPPPMIGILTNDDERLRKVIMTNIKKETTPQELKSWLVEKTGIAESNIVSLEIRAPYQHTDKPVKPTVLADIVFDSTRTTDLCISNLYRHGDKERQLKENTMNMRRSIPDFIKSNKRMKESMHAKSKKIFVASLPKEGCNLEEELTKLIGPLADSEDTKILGEIESYQVIVEKDPVTGERTKTPKGFAFIHVSSEHLADKLAIQCGGGFEIGGRRIDFKKNVDADGRAGRRGMRGHGGYAAQQQWGGYHGYGGFPPQPAYGGYGYGGGYGQPAYGGGYGQPAYGGGYGQQQAYGGYGQQAYGGYGQQAYGPY